MKTMKLDYVEECIKIDRQAYEISRKIIDLVVSATSGRDFSSLEKNSPALKGFDWNIYLKLSSIRMVRALKLVKSKLPLGSRILDFGSYFGNFSLMLAEAGYQVTALDSYENYGDCFDKVTDIMMSRNIIIVNSLDSIGGFDAVLLMGVIEHIPHTPRILLSELRNVLLPKGNLILDTPNLAYVYNRQKFARGESVYVPIQSQYWTELPFEGHHREYNKAELDWMIQIAGFDISRFDAFNYSLYGLTEVRGQDLTNFQLMEADPLMRELFMYLCVRREDRV